MIPFIYTIEIEESQLTYFVSNRDATPGPQTGKSRPEQKEGTFG